MKSLRLTRTKIIAGISIAFAISVVIFGRLTYSHEDSFNNIFWGILGILYMPGLALAALLGGRVHDPSFTLAGILNFAIYSVGLFFTLSRIFRPGAQSVSGAKL